MALAWAWLGVGSGCGGGVVTSPDASDSRLAFTSESAKSTTPHQQDTVPQDMAEAAQRATSELTQARTTAAAIVRSRSLV